MPAWWVNQGGTWSQERTGGYVWAPTKNRAGHPIEPHTNVGRLQPGDAVIHYAGGSIRAVSIVREKPTQQRRPEELPSEPWGDEGHFAKVEYHDLAAPILLSDIPDRTAAAGPFNVDGAVKQGYLYRLSSAFARTLHDTFRDRWPFEWLPSVGEGNRWLFQANPDLWDPQVEVPKVGIGNEDTWTASRHGAEMSPGDPVVLWKSGLQAGIYGVAEITRPLTTRPRPEFRKRSDTDTSGEPVVSVRYKRLLDKPILRRDLLSHPVLANLTVIRAPQGTNYKLTAEEWRAVTELIKASPPPDDPLSRLAEELFLDVSYLRTVRELLEHKGQAIFHGPPGTGKTYVAKKLAEVLTAGGGAVEKVQFHPSYAYEDFVEGYRPRLIGGQPSFALVPGPLRRIAEQAAKTDRVCVLLIDEINRGNVAKVFGELYYLLEYREEQISLQYSAESFALPKNLWIIGTMNTADRSIAMVDAALRRRFHFVPFYPDRLPVEGLLRRWLRANKPGLEWVADAVDRANAQLGNSHMAIGPSHFMRSDLTEDWVKRIWEYSILPYIAEQYFGDDARLEAFALAKLRQPVGPLPAGTA